MSEHPRSQLSSASSPVTPVHPLRLKVSLCLGTIQADEPICFVLNKRFLQYHRGSFQANQWREMAKAQGATLESRPTSLQSCFESESVC